MDLRKLQQGFFIQPKTTRLSQSQIADYHYQEQLRAFKDFSVQDIGKSREYVATFQSPQDCKAFVDNYNSIIDKLSNLEYEILEFKDEIKNHGV